MKTEYIVRERNEDRYGMPEVGFHYGPFPTRENADEFVDYAKREWGWTGASIRLLVTALDVRVPEEVLRLFRAS